MESTLIIDVTTARGCAAKPVEIGLGGDRLTVKLTNFPLDNTETLELYKEANAELRSAQDKARSSIARLEREAAEVNDAPRPPIADERLKEILAYIPAVDFTLLTNRVVLTRLITGWTTARAAEFVRSSAEN